MSTLLAQATQPGADHVMLTVAGVLAAAIAVPFVLAVATSFLKLVVVGHILRSALGTPGVPPTVVITGLAVVLSVHIMTPTAQRAYLAVQQAQAAAAPPTESPSARWQRYAAAAAGPVREFLQQHAHPGEIAMFADLRRTLATGQPVATQPATQPATAPADAADDWTILLPAFVVSELSEAFQIGFILYLPFLVIDLVIGNVLMSMGMFMMSPTTISLPIKLLLFVLVDGWRLITQGLVLGYASP